MAFCRVTTPEIPRNFLESPCSGLRLSTVDAATAPRIFSDLRSLTLWFSALQPSSGPKPPCVLPAPPENPILAAATFEVPKLVLPSRLVPTLPSFLATLFGRSDRHANHLSCFLGLFWASPSALLAPHCQSSPPWTVPIQSRGSRYR